MSITFESYWTKTSTVDWCEGTLHAYEHSRYVAELWNTLSSFVIVLVGMYNFERNKCFGRSKCLEQISSLTATVGISSIVFHATQWKIAQYVDEIAILFFVMSYFFILFGIKNDSPILLLLLPSLLSHNLSVVLLIFFTCMSLLKIIIILLRTRKRSSYMNFLGITLAIIVIFSLWQVDRVNCHPGWPNDLYNFHAMIHLAIAFAVYNFHSFIIQCLLTP